MIRLGPFELQKPIGAGGMGEIWRAVHLSNGVPVAIKVLNPAAEAEQAESFRESFLHEVRLVAGLRHRNVVMALDAGAVPESADRASGGRVRAGSPFLAMELAGGGSLAGKRLESWAETVHVLTQLLDGLAHAHAHGIVHRDVKPGNILLASERSELALAPADVLGSRVVVTDFGIGGSRETRDVADVYATGAPIGTPNYMAPEQIRAAWRDHGPWTDLYAAGCMAWQFVTGNTPFRDANPVRTLAGHLQSPLPAFVPTFDVPAGLQDWLRQLLAKEPSERFAFAADARRTLIELGAAVPGSRRTAAAPIPLGDLPTVIHTGRQREQATMPPSTLGVARGSWAPSEARVEDAGRDFRLEGAGLGLYGLRAIPLVARRAEREILWRALADVQNTRAPRVVVLRGPTGTGKSRLAEWLVRAAHEAGAGAWLRAASSSGLDPVIELAETLRCEGLERAEVIERVAVFLGDSAAPGQIEVLAQLAAPSAFPDAPPLTRRETHAAAEVMLRRLAGDRVAVVWLEDAHRSTEALFLARRVFESASALPVLLLVTVQEEELAERPDEGAFLQSLVAGGAATELPVGPLLAEDHHALVQVLLGLEGSLSQRVEEQTQGNPMFAVQLVGHLVLRGLLTPGDRGFKLRAGATLDVPDSVLAVWEQHAERLLSTFGPHEAGALELAAVFGAELRQSDWTELCSLAGLNPSPDLLTEAMRRRLVRPMPGRVQRWTFLHGMFREVLIKRVRVRAGWEAANRVCATHLRASPRSDPERLARHLLAAGDLLDALAPLHAAAIERFVRGDFRSGALVQDAEAAAKRVGLPELDARWGEIWIDTAWLFQGRGDHTEAERWVVRAERSARRHGWNDVLGRALRMAAQIERRLGRVDEALQLTREAQALFVQLGDHARAAVCKSQEGDLLLQSSPADASAAYKAALAMTSDPREQVNAWKGLANCARRQQDPATATVCLERVRDIAAKVGDRGSLAFASNLLGDFARKAGDLAGAESAYQEAAGRYRALDDATAMIPALNLGILLVHRGAYAEATTSVAPLAAHEERGGSQTVWGCFARSVLLPCAAGLNEWDRTTEHLDWLEGFLPGRKLFEGDIAKMAVAAAKLTAAAGRRDLARRAWRLARDQADGLGDAGGVATADAALATMPPGVLD